MSAKSIFIMVVSVLLTVVLMKNTDEVTFWIFGDVQLPKLAILGVTFSLGFIIGFMARRSGKRKQTPEPEFHEEAERPIERKTSLSDEDRDYIS